MLVSMGDHLALYRCCLKLLPQAHGVVAANNRPVRVVSTRNSLSITKTNPNTQSRQNNLKGLILTNDSEIKILKHLGWN